MILQNGDKVLISNRRLFEQDAARFFVGRTIACEDFLIKVQGFSFVRDLSNGHVVRKQEQRVKVISLSSPGQIVYQLPDDIDLDNVDIKTRHGEDLLLDGPHQVMDLSERLHCGQL